MLDDQACGRGKTWDEEEEDGKRGGGGVDEGELARKMIQKSKP